jgi:ribosomal protein S18 acetylase RimI-like enzyme
VTAIVVGENAQRARAAAQGTALSLTVLAPVDDLAALMSAHDLVISAAGTSVWELCCIGVPTAVVWVVDNQREGYDRVVGAGAAIGLGGPTLGADEGADECATGLLKTALTDGRVLADLSTAGRRIVDGLGAWRVVATWEQVHRQPQRQKEGTGRSARVPEADSGALVARPATLQDARLLWQWRNDPVTRAGSRSPQEVSWDDHLRWLTSSLARSDRLLLVVQDVAGPVGTVRWDLDGQAEGSADGGHEWEVSITVAPHRRGRSLGRPLLRAAELALSEAARSEAMRSSATAVSAYLAVVHVDNLASVRLFEASAYVPDLPPDPRGFMRFRKTARVP